MHISRTTYQQTAAQTELIGAVKQSSKLEKIFIIRDLDGR